MAYCVDRLPIQCLIAPAPVVGVFSEKSAALVEGEDPHGAVAVHHPLYEVGHLPLSTLNPKP